MNLVLIGYRGTGKSTIGARLAAMLDMAYVSLDAEIAARAGMPIPEIVSRAGWDRFRDLEEEAVADAAARDGQVLDTGGGVVVRPENIRRLKERGIVFLLEARVEDIIARIGGGEDRPSLTGAKSFTEEVAEVLAAREPGYRKAADVVIDTSRRAPEEAAAAIAEEFRRRAGV
ncbi:MAG TPA: shikimate kinase [Planctomycetes bacterium]|nr:shikimate kinase [Planctomycetota bacterium]